MNIMHKLNNCMDRTFFTLPDYIEGCTRHLALELTQVVSGLVGSVFKPFVLEMGIFTLT